MFKNIKIRYSAVALIALGLSSCGKFGDVNVNPNAASVPKTSALLTNVETYMGSDAVGAPNPTITTPISGFLTPYYTQHYSQVQYPDNQLYPSTGLSWDNTYAVILEDLYNIISVNSASPNVKADGGNSINQIQIARILKAYYFSILTDKYGDVPYTQALIKKADPAYDKQQAIYTDLLKELTDAPAAFQIGVGDPIVGDIIYGGDLTKWKRFANSLRLSLAMRLSKVDPTTGKAQFLAALNDAGGLITDNTMNVKLSYPGGSFNFPMYNLTTASVVAISKPFADKLISYKDPRRFVYAVPNATSKEIAGFPYGLNRTNAQIFIASKAPYSLAYSSTYKTATSSVYIFTAAYVDLLRAEGAITYNTADDPTTYLTKSVTDSWAQWNATNAVPAGAVNVAPDAASYVVLALAGNGGSLLKTIQEQYWVALWGSEQNAYDEWRRTGMPALTPAPDATNPSKTIPRRFQYPTTEVNYNPTNYNAAIAVMPYGGGDTDNNKVWWDK
ncbi:SusD/RagB family nutrient-binding outer membrane lipoprotein [Mucilaginibacter sp. AW1-3]